MKTWQLACLVESGDDMTAGQVFQLIDRDCNRGDGIYLKIATWRGEKPNLRLLKTEPEEVE